MTEIRGPQDKKKLNVNKFCTFSKVRMYSTKICDVTVSHSAVVVLYFQFPRGFSLSNTLVTDLEVESCQVVLMFDRQAL